MTLLRLMLCTVSYAFIVNARTRVSSADSTYLCSSGVLKQGKFSRILLDTSALLDIVDFLNQMNWVISCLVVSFKQ